MVIKLEMNFSLDQLESTINQLPLRDRVRLIEKLMGNKETSKEQFRRVLSRIRARFKKYPMTQKEINEIVEEAREEYYAKNRR